MSDERKHDDGSDDDPATGLPEALPGGPDDEPGDGEPLVEADHLDADDEG